MRLNIFSKLFLAMLLATLLVVLVVVGFMNWSFHAGFTRFHHESELRQVQTLADKLGIAFAEHKNWDFIRHDPKQWTDLLDELGGRGEPREPPPQPQPPPFSGTLPDFGRPPPPHGDLLMPPPLSVRLHLLDAGGESVLDEPVMGDPMHLGQRNANNLSTKKVAVRSKSGLVGWIAVLQGKVIPNELEQTFLSQQMRNLYLIGLFAAGLSFLLAILLVRHFLHPVNSLTKGAKSLTAGKFDTRIDVTTQDELGILAENFNTLAGTLQHNEAMRQQWIADISHELRTPIAVLRSEIEAMLDGIRTPTLERVRSLHVDVLSLGKLVEDLYQLSLLDTSEPHDFPQELLNLTDILHDAAMGAETRLQEKSIRLLTRFDPDKPLTIRGSDARLFQLFSNLLANSHRYTDDNGCVEILAASQGGKVQVTIQDSAPGVPEAALPRLFERLFRVDKSRSRALGGSGLGLAICKTIAEAHGGTIQARHSPLGGLAIDMEFPQAHEH